MKFGESTLTRADLPDPEDFPDSMTIGELRAAIAARFPAVTPRRAVDAAEMIGLPLVGYDRARFEDTKRAYPLFVARFQAGHPQFLAAVYAVLLAVLGREPAADGDRAKKAAAHHSSR